MTSPTNEYIFAVDPWGFEVTVQAETYKEAHKLAWNALTDAEKDNCECLDLVDTSEV